MTKKELLEVTNYILDTIDNELSGRLALLSLTKPLLGLAEEAGLAANSINDAYRAVTRIKDSLEQPTFDKALNIEKLEAELLRQRMR